MKRSTATIAAFLTGLLILLGSMATAAPPIARKVEVADRIFGLTLPDPYRWMEGDNNTEFQGWVKAQGALTRTKLDASAQLASWQRRLQAAGSATTINRLQRRIAGRIFFLRIEGARRGVLMVRDADGRERMLLDPNAIAPDPGPASITEYSPSPDGKTVAVNVDRGGSEITTVSLINVDSGATLNESFHAIWGEFPVIWFPDSSGFTYTQMAPVEPGSKADPMQNMRVRVHRLGDAVQDDKVTLAAGLSQRFPLRPEEFPFVDASASSDWALAVAGGARPEVRICIASRKDATTLDAPWNCLIDYADKIQGYSLRGSMLYLLSVKDAPNGQVIALDLNRPRPRLADANTVLAASSEMVLTGLAQARDGLYVRRMSNGIDGLVRLRWEGGPSAVLNMPFQGAAFLMFTQAQDDGIVFTLQSWTRPRQLYAYDSASGQVTDLQLGATSPSDYGDIAAMETEARSADGTRVPLSIIYRKDLLRNGHALAILDGYGAYGESSQPYFDPALLEWVKAGHVYAFAHVRGGGEKGSTWWQGGKGPLKHKGVEDFVACARQLVKLKFTSQKRMAASGASAGGLLIGGAITLAPMQFGAAVVHAGMLNPVRLLSAANGANQIAEVGDPRTAAGLKALKAMDPYQRVRDGSHYPAVLLAVGVNDSRVSPWESGKFGARVAAATRSDKPVWFRVSGDQGHFSGSISERAAELSDTYTFLELQLMPQ